MIEWIFISIFIMVFIYLTWRRLDWAIVITVAALPAYLLRFELGLVPMTVLEIMLLTVIGVFAVRTVPQGLRQRTCPAYVPWRWLLLLWVLAGVVAVIISPDIRSALGLWKAYIIEPVLFFIVFVNIIKTPKQVRAVLWALGALVVLIGFGAMLQYLGIAGIPAHYGDEVPPRATAMFPFPTAVGKFVGPLLALFLGLFLTRRPVQAGSPSGAANQRLAQMWMIGVIGFGALGLILSVSRGAMLGVLVALIFISFFSVWKKWIWLGLAGLVIVAFLIAPVRTNIIGVFQASDVSTDVRLVMWQGAWRIIEDNPVAGTGLASFPVVYEDYKEASHTEFFPNPDQLILTLWIEMGLAGLTLFMWLVVKFFTAGSNYLRRNPYVVGLFAAMIALLVHGMLDTPYFKNDLAVQWWILVGLLLVIIRHKYFIDEKVLSEDKAC